ncbi:MAG: MerR family transcriptional regulator, partial [Pseudomonadota bacterium]
MTETRRRGVLDDNTGQTSTRRTFTISDLAKEFEITPRAIRFYEARGLLEPQRRGSQRIYSRRDRGRLILIIRGK